MNRIYNRIIYLCLLVFLSGGCVSSLTGNLSKAILNHDDPATIAEATPAYLIIVDSFIAGDPDDEDLLQSGAALYAAYTGLFVNEPERAKRLSDRAFNYGQRGVCEYEEDLCELKNLPFADMSARLASLDDGDDLPYLGALAQSWLVWIKAHADDWNAIADLPRVEELLKTILRIDETWNGGSAHVYMGLLKTLRPPALGGKPEEAREHFERALEISNGANLGAKVALAENYARLVFDRELHDRLLMEVLAANPDAGGQTLLNVIAQRRARELLDSAYAYF